MRFKPTQGIWQIALGQSRRAEKLVATAEADEDTSEADQNAMRRSLLSVCPVWRDDNYQRACPYPMVVHESQLTEIEEIHRFLSSAITNIIERWWIDEKAQFPQRMPLEKHEEEVLKILDGLLTLFNPGIPLHLLKGEEAGIDNHHFILYAQSIKDRTPTLIRPSALRLLPDASSPTGNKLYCAVGIEANGDEVLDRVYQTGLELHQHEMRSLSPALLHEISLCCFNDLRTIFLVHDRRMLGIVLQELDSLVNVHKIITPAEARILRRSITPTTLPGSPELMRLVELSEQSPDTKIFLLLKPIRSGKGAGIVFGSDRTPEEWLSYLTRMREPQISSERITYIIQHRIQQSCYDVLLDETDGL